MNAATEWSELSEQWQTQPADWRVSLGELRRRDRGDRVRRAVVIAGEVGVTVLMVGLTLRVMGPMSGLTGATVMGSVIAYTAAIWAFALWNRRGTWRPLGETVEAYLALSIRRRESALRGVALASAAGWCLLLAAAGLVLFRRTNVLPAGSHRLAIVVWATMGAGFLAWTILYGRRTRAELTRLRQSLAAVREDHPVA